MISGFRARYPTPRAAVQFSLLWLNPKRLKCIADDRDLGRSMKTRNNRLYCAASLFLLFGCASNVPGGTSTNAALQRDIIENISVHEQLLLNSGCRRFTVADTQVLDRRPDRTVMTERWIIDRCGQPVAYRVNLTPAPE